MANPPADQPTSFAGVGLPQELVTTLERRGVRAPFAIQSRTLPDALAGCDVLGRAQTGSGKTLGFGLPMLARLHSEQGPRTPGSPRGLVLVPTRELAQQVTDAIAPLAKPLNLRVTSVYGGASMGRQISALRGGVDVVVATPGRLLDLIEQGECTLGMVSIAVVDEADYMADLGFLPVVTQLLDMTPAGGQRMLFSATLDRGVDKLVARFLRDPAYHAVADATSHVDAMDHKVFALAPEHKVPVAAEMAARPARTLFFARTKHGADRLAKQLTREGVAAGAIHGNLNQNARQRALDAFAAGSPRVLVATDVAARGIHVDDVDLVVHFDPPADHKDYLHRSGRTARAGASGTVVSLVQPGQERDLAQLQRLASVEADFVRVRPGAEAVREVATSGEPFEVVPVQRATPEQGDRPRRTGRGNGARRGGQGGRGQGSRAQSSGGQSRGARSGGSRDGAAGATRSAGGPSASGSARSTSGRSDFSARGSRSTRRPAQGAR